MAQPDGCNRPRVEPESLPSSHAVVIRVGDEGRRSRGNGVLELVRIEERRLDRLGRLARSLGRCDRLHLSPVDLDPEITARQGKLASIAKDRGIRCGDRKRPPKVAPPLVEATSPVPEPAGPVVADVGDEAAASTASTSNEHARPVRPSPELMPIAVGARHPFVAVEVAAPPGGDRSPEVDRPGRVVARGRGCDAGDRAGDAARWTVAGRPAPGRGIVGRVEPRVFDGDHERIHFGDLHGSTTCH